MNTLRQSIEEYLAMRRSLGFKLKEAGKALPDFVAFMERRRASYITQALALTLIQSAENFYHDFIEPTKKPYIPNAAERPQLAAIADWLRANTAASAEEIEKKIYDFGRQYYDKPGLDVISGDPEPRDK